MSLTFALGTVDLMPNLEKDTEQDIALDMEGLGWINLNLSAPQISLGERWGNLCERDSGTDEETRVQVERIR